MLVHAAVAEFLEESRKLSTSDAQLKDLILKAANKDSDAFSQLYTKFTPLLMSLARNKAKGAAKSDIEDIVQNVFLKFYEKELPKIAKKIESGQKDPGYLIAVLKNSVRNATIDANKAAGRKGMSHKRINTVEPSTAGLAGASEKHLGPRSKKIVRAAFKRALAKAHLAPNERMFIAQIFGGGGSFTTPSYGSLAAIAAKHGIGKDKDQKQRGGLATKIKTKFLKFFCNDKELCDLLPRYKGHLGRARTKGVKLPGLGANVCKDVGVCTEFFWKLTGDHFIVEDECVAEDLVLSWLMGVLSPSE